MSGQKVLIAMSGGVDSSVAALLLKEEGFDCAGAIMRMFGNQTFSAEKNVSDAAAVAERLVMPFHVFDCRAEFDEKVIRNFVKEYDCGHTPNPCVECNRFLKFGLFFDKAESLGFDFVATGHYARIEYDSGLYRLKKALDHSKDQSYFLYFLTQNQLARIRFPLGGLNKAETRKIAEASGFRNSSKNDSQDICFIPDGNYVSFIESFTKKKLPGGIFQSLNGKFLGKHDGHQCFTIGQRRGLGISSSEPLYVLSKNPSENAVTLGTSEKLFSKTLFAENVNWISGITPASEFRAKVRIRYRQSEQPATIIPLDNNMVSVCFDEPQRAITIGQSVVFFEEDEVLGGGKICENQYVKRDLCEIFS